MQRPKARLLEQCDRTSARGVCSSHISALPTIRQRNQAIHTRRSMRVDDYIRRKVHAFKRLTMPSRVLWTRRLVDTYFAPFSVVQYRFTTVFSCNVATCWVLPWCLQQNQSSIAVQRCRLVLRHVSRLYRTTAAPSSCHNTELYPPLNRSPADSARI